MHANARARPCLGAGGGRTGGAQSREEEEEKSPVKGVSNYFLTQHNSHKTRTSGDAKALDTQEIGKILEKEQITRVDCSVAEWRARQWKWGVSGAPANVRDGHPASYTRRKAFSSGNIDVRPISKDTQWLLHSPWGIQLES